MTARGSFLLIDICFNRSFRSTFVVACDRDNQVEHLEIEPQHGEGKTERRLPLILFGQLILHHVIDGGEVTDQEQRRDDDEYHREADRYRKVISDLHDCFGGSRDERADQHQQRYRDHRDEQRHHHRLELLGHADEPGCIEDCHHQNDRYGDRQCQKTEILISVEYLEDQKRDQIALCDAVQRACDGGGGLCEESEQLEHDRKDNAREQCDHLACVQ